MVQQRPCSNKSDNRQSVVSVLVVRFAVVVAGRDESIAVQRDPLCVFIAFPLLSFTVDFGGCPNGRTMSHPVFVRETGKKPSILRKTPCSTVERKKLHVEIGNLRPKLAAISHYWQFAP